MSHTRQPTTALITGASSGIGAIYADRMAKRGHNLVLVARDRDRLNALATGLTRENRVNVEIIAADLTVKADLARVEQRLRDDAAINMLINNAGRGVDGTIATAQPDQMEAMILLNVLAPTLLTRAILPRLLAQEHGTIINLASVLALTPEMFGGSYSATKSYLFSLTLALHEEVGKHGIQVQAVLPGVTRTEIWERSGKDINALLAEMIMEAGEMVDAALVGLDMRELVTIPSLPDLSDWTTYNAARLYMGPNLSREHAAERYRKHAISS
jgi:short-subunit dehydrogenase